MNTNHISNRPAPFGQQVYFWLTENGDLKNWLQLITDYAQAEQIATWLGHVINGTDPEPLHLALNDGTLDFVIAGNTVTISGKTSGGSLAVDFAADGFGWMFCAVVLSVNAMVHGNTQVMDDVESQPPIKRAMGS